HLFRYDPAGAATYTLSLHDALPICIHIPAKQNHLAERESSESSLPEDPVEQTAIHRVDPGDSVTAVGADRSGVDVHHPKDPRGFVEEGHPPTQQAEGQRPKELDEEKHHASPFLLTRPAFMSSSISTKES